MIPGPKRLPMIAFKCTRCGSCCSSAPELSLPELFHHQRRFIGCLSLRRVDCLQPGTSPPSATPLGIDDCQEFDSWVPQFVHQAQGLHGKVFVALTTRAYDDPSLSRCPSLTADNLCALEQDNKPLGCRAVPLEPLLPDSLQHHLLQTRAKEAAFVGAQCILEVAGTPDALLVTGKQIAESTTRQALNARRNALIEDKRYWGSQVFTMLRHDLLADPARVSSLPSGDYLALSLTPILSALCAASQRVRLRVTEYLTAQVELLAATLNGTIQKPAAIENTLLGFFRANLTLRAALLRDRHDAYEAQYARELEAWLGLSP